MTREKWAATLVAGGLGLTPMTAWADAIDGDWCSADGRHMSINGPRLVTPGGTHMEGQYRRHSFAYTVPASEPAAGTEVALVLIHDDLLHATRAGGDDVEAWQRCKFTS